jgi:DNA-binding NtrC family response regulator
VLYRKYDYQSGNDKDIKVDVRVVAYYQLKVEIAEGRFREDLYHRLA